MNLHERKIAEAMGHDRSKPLVQFFDHATLNAQRTQESGRPRYDSRIYIRKIPSAPDLVVRDVFDRAMMEEDKQDYPEEWAKYCERKAAIANLKPPITAIPGMDVSAKAELEALGIYHCDDFINYSGNLDGLEELRETARAIMEVSNAVREKRDDVRTARGRQVHQDSGVSRAKGTVLSFAEGSAQKGYEEKDFQEKGNEAGQTFHYEIKI